MKPKKKKKILIFFISALLIIMGGGIFYVYTTIYHPNVSINKYKYPIMGIDISAHNGNIDFNKVKNDSISFVYIKATEGASFSDSLFEKNYLAAREAQIPVGAYHFFRFDINGVFQGMNLLRAIDEKTFNLPIAIDVEEHGNPETTTSSVIRRLQDMIDFLEEHDKHIIIYTNYNGYKRFFRSSFADYPLWICRFSHPDENIEWQFWQYSHWGEVDGVQGDVDLDIFCGQKEDFQNWITDYSF